MRRLASAHSDRRAAQAPRQPPYVIVLETCGIAGGRAQREGEWTRVLIDPPEPMPILASAPGSSHTPISALANLGIVGAPIFGSATATADLITGNGAANSFDGLAGMLG